MFLLRVIIRTMRLNTSCAIVAFIDLIIIRMKLLFLPSVAELAFEFVWTALSIARYHFRRRPIGAQFFRIGEYLRFPPEILPIMSINAYIPLVIIFVIGTPNRLEMVEVEISIPFKVLDHFYRDFFD